jgi:uncharacterized protein
MPAALLTLELLLPGCASLKEKRGRIRPLLVRLQREFNVSSAELDRLDAHGTAVLGCACLSNDAVHCRQVLETALAYTRKHFPDVEIEEYRIVEIL